MLGGPVRGGRHRLHGRGRRRAGRARRPRRRRVGRRAGAGVTPAGLGARDTLRLETGLPLHGHELGPGITPLQAGLGWVVAWGKGDFRGRAALEAERERASPAGCGASWSRAGARPAPTSRCWSTASGRGVVTSGNFSPTLRPASPWPSCRPTSGRAPRWRSTSVARRAGPGGADCPSTARRAEGRAHVRAAGRRVGRPRIS